MEGPKYEVKVIRRETIKPSSPTPSNHGKLTLSFLDQKYGPHHVPVLLFYTAPEGAVPLDTTLLKTCLSETLTRFYPLAGQYDTWGTLLCNDHGVPFIEAIVDCTLLSLLHRRSNLQDIVDFLPFYPPREDILSSKIHLAIQVNVFTCGGFAVGWYHTHKVTDGVSAATFFRHWSALVTNRYEVAALAEPDFSAGVAAFPPLPEAAVTPALKPKEGSKEDKNKFSWNYTFQETIVVRSFLFKDDAINELKAMSISEKVIYPSRFEAVTGFLWKHILLASPKEGHSMLGIPVDLRSKTDPPLPRGSMGNLFTSAFARTNNRAELRDMVSEIHGSISKMKNVALKFQGENRSEEYERLRRQFINTVIEYKGKDIYFVNSWCKSAGFGDVDFGFGKPKRVIPIDDAVNHNKRNGILLTEFTDSNGDGIEAWLFLEKDTIKFLECNPDFLAFASPNF
ncbi:hypothetical protein RND81_03G165100 [Saponaria officinalis]|uniref:Transferase n=1 Tax=Saponaria officinalis TaxID=3572 RepID=A0AAW1M8W2_SAPOF